MTESLKKEVFTKAYADLIDGKIGTEDFFNRAWDSALSQCEQDIRARALEEAALVADDYALAWITNVPLRAAATNIAGLIRSLISQPAPAMDDVLERVAKGFETFFSRAEKLDVGYVVDSIRALKTAQPAAPMTDELPEEITPMLLANAAFCCETGTGNFVSEEGRQDIITKLLTAAEKMQAKSKERRLLGSAKTEGGKE